jgi:hypothetical protein
MKGRGHTPDQFDWMMRWSKAPVYTIRDVLHAVELVRAIRKAGRIEGK